MHPVEFAGHTAPRGTTSPISRKRKMVKEKLSESLRAELGRPEHDEWSVEFQDFADAGNQRLPKGSEQPLRRQLSLTADRSKYDDSQPNRRSIKLESWRGDRRTFAGQVRHANIAKHRTLIHIARFSSQHSYQDGDRQPQQQPADYHAGDQSPELEPPVLCPLRRQSIFDVGEGQENSLIERPIHGSRLANDKTLSQAST